MLSLLTLFSQGLLGCRGQRRRVEGNIRFLFPAWNVTTLIIDLGNERFCSFGVFLACPFNEDSGREIWEAAESLQTGHASTFSKRH